MNSCLSPRNGRGFQACADLEMQMLRLFFEMDAVGVAAGVAVLRAASQGESVSRPRRALLFLVADGGEGPEGWERVYQEARSEGDPEVGAAACIAAVDATQANYDRPRTRYDRTLRYFAMVAFDGSAATHRQVGK